VVFICAGLLAASAPVFQGAQNSPEIRIELYPEGQHTNPAILLLRGERYEPSLAIPVPLDSPNQPDDIQFLSRMLTLSANGTLEEFLKQWDTRDRENIRKVASDPKLFEGNQNFYRSITASRLLAKVHYGSYEIFYVAHTTPGVKALVKDYPVTHQGDSLVLTNALQSDPVYTYLSTKYTQMLRQSLEKSK
jgi:hypothetical protein